MSIHFVSSIRVVSSIGEEKTTQYIIEDKIADISTFIMDKSFQQKHI